MSALAPLYLDQVWMQDSDRWWKRRSKPSPESYRRGGSIRRGQDLRTDRTTAPARQGRNVSERPSQKLSVIGQLRNIQAFHSENITKSQPWFLRRLRWWWWWCWVPEGIRTWEPGTNVCLRFANRRNPSLARRGARSKLAGPRLFNGVVGQQREESRLQNTVPLLPKKSGALCNPKPALLASFSANLPIPYHFLHPPPPPNFLILPNFAARTARSSTSSHPDRGSSSLSPATATLIIPSRPLRGFSSAASFRNSSELEI
jgi:hypothetical protein